MLLIHRQHEKNCKLCTSRKDGQYLIEVPEYEERIRKRRNQNAAGGSARRNLAYTEEYLYTLLKGVCYELLATQERSSKLSPV